MLKLACILYHEPKEKMPITLLYQQVYPPSELKGFILDSVCALIRCSLLAVAPQLGHAAYIPVARRLSLSGGENL